MVDGRPTTTTGRPAIRVGSSGRPAAVEQQVLLAAQELAGVVGEGVQLGGQARCGPGPSRSCTCVEVEDAAGGEPRSGRRADDGSPVVDPDGPVVPDRGRALLADPVDEHDAGLGEHLRDRGWRSDRRSSGRR